MTSRLFVTVCSLLLAAASAHAQVSPVLQGDPVDGFGRAHFILPGVPLITENGDGDFNPPVVDPGTIGDVDLVVRAGHLTPGATMPPPVLMPPTAAAGGTRFPGGSDIPFTVIASDGDPTVAGGHPLLGPELDRIPVLVLAFADLDRDGVVGPTNGDAAGAADNALELQESEFPVGIRVAYFGGGVAQGVVAADVGAPASAGGLPVVLAAAAYVGQFSPDFFLGTVPDGPAIATLLPFFPRLDPDRVIDTDGSAGPAMPDGRIGVEFESEFEPLAGDPVLGSAFALPTDGSSITIDRALVGGGTVASAQFMRPVSAAGFTGNEPRLPLRPGAAGVLYETLPGITLEDDGAGNGVAVRLVPIDTLGTVTDATPPVAVDLVASAGLTIAAPDTDGDPTRERIDLGDGVGFMVTVDDAAGTSADGAVIVEMDGIGVARLAVDVTGTPPGGTAPIIDATGFVEEPGTISLACPAPRTLFARVHDAESDASGATAVLTQAGVEVGRLELAPGAPPVGTDTWMGSFPLPTSLPVDPIVVTFTARDLEGHLSDPVTFMPSILDVAPTSVADVTVTPSPLAPRMRSKVVIAARVSDDCGVRRVSVRVQRGERFRRFLRMNDRGRKGDPVASDGIFTGTRRLRVRDVTSLGFEITARNARGTSTTEPVTVPVAP